MLASTAIPIYFKNTAEAAGVSMADSTADWSFAASLCTLIVAFLCPARYQELSQVVFHRVPAVGTAFDTDVAFPCSPWFAKLSKRMQTHKLIEVYIIGCVFITLFALQSDQAWEFWFLVVRAAVFRARSRGAVHGATVGQTRPARDETSAVGRVKRTDGFTWKSGAGRFHCKTQQRPGHGAKPHGRAFVLSDRAVSAQGYPIRPATTGAASVPQPARACAAVLPSVHGHCADEARIAPPVIVRGKMHGCCGCFESVRVSCGMAWQSSCTYDLPELPVYTKQRKENAAVQPFAYKKRYENGAQSRPDRIIQAMEMERLMRLY